MKIPIRKQAVGAIIGIALLLLSFLFIGTLLNSEELLTRERLVTWLQDAGPFAPFLLIATMAVAVVISPIPSLPLDLAAGAAFGPILGTAYAVIGAEIGAIASFLIARALGRDLLTRLAGTDVVFCERCSDRHLILLLIFARLLPVFSFDVISYGAGLTNMSLRAFALATLVGMIPPTFALTYLGTSLITIQWPLILGGVLMVGFFLLVPKLVMRYPSAWWARLFLAATPAPAPVPNQNPEPSAHEEQVQVCSGCGVPLH